MSTDCTVHDRTLSMCCQLATVYGLWTQEPGAGDRRHYLPHLPTHLRFFLTQISVLNTRGGHTQQHGGKRTAQPPQFGYLIIVLDDRNYRGVFFSDEKVDLEHREHAIVTKLGK